MSTRLVDKLFVTGFLRTESGLCIGGSEGFAAMAGLDRAVLRDGLTGAPYVPASSLKGKMRSLLERLAGEFSSSARVTAGPITSLTPHTDLGRRIVALFGVPADPKAHRFNLPRLTVRDAALCNAAALRRSAFGCEFPYTEVKTEIAVDRVTSQMAGTLRHIERVPAGALFALEFVITRYEVDGARDDARELFETLCLGLELLQDDALGSAGSRGYGRVRVHLEKPAAKHFAVGGAGVAPEPCDLAVPPALRFDETQLQAARAQQDRPSAPSRAVSAKERPAPPPEAPPAPEVLESDGAAEKPRESRKAPKTSENGSPAETPSISQETPEHPASDAQEAPPELELSDRDSPQAPPRSEDPGASPTDAPADT